MNKFLSGKGLYIHDIRLLILLTFLTNVKKYFEIPAVERFIFFEICLSYFFIYVIAKNSPFSPLVQVIKNHSIPMVERFIFRKNFFQTYVHLEKAKLTRFFL